MRKDYSVNFNGGADKTHCFFSIGYPKEPNYTIRLWASHGKVKPECTGLKRVKCFLPNTARDGRSASFVNPFFYSREYWSD